MLLNAENGRLELEGGGMDYIRFGSGERILVILPGVGDGFRTVKGTALPFALGYRKLAEDFTVYLKAEDVSSPFCLPLSSKESLWASGVTVRLCSLVT